MRAANNIRFTEKYPVTNGDRFLKGDDPTILQNKTTGRITGSFKTTTLGVVFSTSNENAIDSSGLSVRVGRTYALMFSSYLSNDETIFFGINSLPITYFLDGLYHSFEVIIDGIDNRIVVDGITYNGANLTFNQGFNTSTIFMDTLLTSAVLGSYRYKYQGNLSNILYFKGNIYNLTIYDTDLITKLYEVSVNGTTITASSPTTLVSNKALNLKFQNNYTDYGDDNIVATPINAPVFSYSAYGIEEHALYLNGTNQYLTLNNNGAIQSVLFRIKADTNTRDIIELASGIKISLNASNEIETTGLTNVIIKVNTFIRSTIKLNQFQFVYVEFDEITALNSKIGFSTTYFSGTFDNIIFYKYKVANTELKMEFLSKDTSYNIVLNMGGYGTTKFIDSNGDGLADDLSIYSGGLYSIVEDEGGRGQKLYSEIGGNLGYYVGGTGGLGTVPQLEIGGTYQFYIKYKNNTVNSKFHRYLDFLPNSNNVVSEFTGVYTLTTETQIVPIINFPSSVAGDYLTIYNYTIIKL